MTWEAYERVCPKCGENDWQPVQRGGLGQPPSKIDWLSTTNEWCWYCRDCDVRFNGQGELRPTE